MLPAGRHRERSPLDVGWLLVDKMDSANNTTNADRDQGAWSEEDKKRMNCDLSRFTADVQMPSAVFGGSKAIVS